MAHCARLSRVPGDVKSQCFFLFFFSPFRCADEGGAFHNSRNCMAFCSGGRDAGRSSLIGGAPGHPRRLEAGGWRLESGGWRRHSGSAGSGCKFIHTSQPLLLDNAERNSNKHGSFTSKRIAHLAKKLFYHQQKNALLCRHSAPADTRLFYSSGYALSKPATRLLRLLR